MVIIDAERSMYSSSIWMAEAARTPQLSFFKRVLAKSTLRKKITAGDPACH